MNAWHKALTISITVLTATLLSGARYYIHCESNESLAPNYYYDIPARLYPSQATPHIVYCGDTWVYISESDETHLNSLLRQGINMVLKVDGDYIDSPCF